MSQMKLLIVALAYQMVEAVRVLNTTARVSVSNVTFHASPLALVSSRINPATFVGHKYGHPKCPCIGLDKVEGTTIAVIGTTEARYPADLGGRCEAWDDNNHPFKCMPGQNPGKGHGWCRRKWCYVDPCNCDLGITPTISSYIPFAEHQARPVYYSYATCGADDFYTAVENLEACVNKKTETTCNKYPRCAWSGTKCMGKALIESCTDPSFHPAERTWGEEQCRCVGINNQPGTRDVHIGHKTYEYPADIGAVCKAWDDEQHPDCKGSKKPDWCLDRWCYVDPCDCGIEVPPKPSSYLTQAKYRGRPLHYSYSTCGGRDRRSAESHARLDNQIEYHCSGAWIAIPLPFAVLVAGIALGDAYLR